ncbi:MAG: nitrilase-related carbon-nitrogen hydrolase [Thiohalospira sp.]
MKHKILSCIPFQLSDTQEKLEWLHKTTEKHKPHIFVTPQEFFGGAVMMPHKRDFKFDELFPDLSKLCKKYNMALVVGVQERDDDGSNKTAIWFINEKGKYLGRVVKFALPKYDHIATSGFGNVVPEDNFENRFKTFKLHNLETSAMFCWEVYSDILWTGLGLTKPDVIFSLIKFGPNAWPTVKKIKGKNTVVDFGYGRWAEEDDGGWIARLKMANIWQVKCPIICSTNGWNQNPRSMPICGTISGIDGQAENDHWYPRKTDKLKKIPEKIIISTIDENAVRGSLKNKWIYKELTGEFPPYSLGKYTMHLKINRIEDRVLKAMQTKKQQTLFD